MQQQLIIMLQLQDAMNAKVNSAWRQQGYAWHRAIWVECAELMDHFGWKWWKKQSPDLDQVVLELIDIWHFGLSLYLLTADADEASYAALAETIEAEYVTVMAAQPEKFREYLEDFTETTLRTKQFCIPEFCRLLQAVNLDFDQLFSNYVGKNVLNLFRQDHGYKDGAYFKLWAGREDNEHLIEALAEIDPSREDFADALYKNLESRYPKA